MAGSNVLTRKQLQKVANEQLCYENARQSDIKADRVNQ